MTRLMRIFLVAAFVASASPALAQDRTNISSGATLPATCIVGDVYMKTGTSAGVYACLTLNTWTASGGGGSPAGSTGNVQINSSGSFGAYAGTSATANQVMTGLSASGAATSSAVTNAMLAGAITASNLVGTDIATVGTITAGVWNGTKIDVAHGGTNLTSGTSGGVLGYTAPGVLASSAALTVNLPIIGGGAGATPTSGTVSGNTTKFATMSGSITSGNCVKVDASGNLVDFGGACGGSGSPGGSDTQVQFNDSSSFGGDAGLVFNKTANTLTSTGTMTAAGYNNAYVTKTANYTLTATDGVVECLSNAFTLTLPTAAGITGRIYTAKNLQTANVCTVDPAGAETIDGAATASVVNGALSFQSDGTNWRSIGASGIPIGVLTQGDILYASAANTITSLAKDTNATRYLANTGTNNNPAWNSINLANGVGSSILPVSNGGTGSATTITLPTPVVYIAGVSQAGTASIACSTPSSGAASAVSAATTVPPVGVASFSGSAANEIDCAFITPSDWTTASTVDITIWWRAVSTSGNVNWQVATQFIGDGTVLNTAYNTASTVADAAKGTTLQVNTATITGVTATNIAASKLAFLKILRDGGVGADTMSGTAEVIGFIVTIRRSPAIGG